jgi:hypothetical protein
MRSEMKVRGQNSIERRLGAAVYKCARTCTFPDKGTDHYDRTAKVHGVSFRSGRLITANSETVDNPA